VQLGHAVGARALEADDDDDIAVELAGLERLEHLILVGEAAARRLDRPALLGDRAGLEDGAAEIAADQPHPAVGQERIARRAEHVDVGAFLGRLPRQLVAVSSGLRCISVQIVRAGGQRCRRGAGPRVEQV
jgi:hypothetical protein